jgi:hypothetical protein
MGKMRRRISSGGANLKGTILKWEGGRKEGREGGR